LYTYYDFVLYESVLITQQGEVLVPLNCLSAIFKAQRQLDRHLADHWNPLGVGPAEGHFLIHLRSYSPVPVSELYRDFGIKRSTLTSLFDRLEARGWVARRPSPRDRRAVVVQLTDSGRVRADRVHDALERLGARVEASVPPDDLRGFVAVISAITARTGDAGESTRG
jgi:DNA-binding MarR family transcriptional regulator